MELLFLVGLLVSSIVIFLLIHSYLFHNNHSHPNLPPGKFGIPFLGETLEFLSTGKKGYPEKFVLDRISKHSSQVFKTSILGQPTIVLSGLAGNKLLFSNENKLVVACWPDSVNKLFPSSTQTSSMEEAKKLRKMLPNFLKPEALKMYIPIMDSIAKRHFQTSWEGQNQVKVFPLSKMYTFWVACKLFLSIEDPEQVSKIAGPFNVLASGIINMPIDLPGTPFNRAVKASKWIRSKLVDIIKQRKIDLAENKASPKQDILSHMLLTADEDGQCMKELDIATKILGLLVGGHDTASAAITFAMKYLAELPHIYKEVLMEQMEIAKSKKPGELLGWDDIQRMKYTWSVACEVLRLAPPLQGGFREVINDFIFSGFYIPRGWKLYWSAGVTHRNPEYFPNPEKFDPTRHEGTGPAPYTFIPFGGGPRICPGKEYARLEILVFLHNVVTRFRWEKLLPHENIIVDPLPMPANNLPIRLFHHHTPLVN